MIFGILRPFEPGDIRVVDIGRRCGFALLDLKYARSDAGDFAVEVDSTLLAHTNPLADADFQDAGTDCFRRRVSRLRRHRCWGKDGKDRDDRNPTRWLLAEKIYMFHAHRC